MGTIKLPDKAKLFIGIIGINKRIIDKVKDKLVKNWGKIDLESAILPFNRTDYYKEEMGDNLIKIFFRWHKLFY